jgi:hypothetical protein
MQMKEWERVLDRAIASLVSSFSHGQAFKWLKLLRIYQSVFNLNMASRLQQQERNDSLDRPSAEIQIKKSQNEETIGSEEAYLFVLAQVKLLPLTFNFFGTLQKMSRHQNGVPCCISSTPDIAVNFYWPLFPLLVNFSGNGLYRGIRTILRYHTYECGSFFSVPGCAGIEVIYLTSHAELGI